jgi:hypothetical protein
MRPRLLRRLAVGLAAPSVVVLGLAACGSDDVSREQLRSELEDQSRLTGEQAGCVADRLFDQLDQDQINELYEDEELSGEVDEVADAVLEECVTPG